MSRGRGTVAVSRQHVMAIARGIYDTGKNRVTSRTEPIRVAGVIVDRLCIVEVNGRRVASGAGWAHAYSNLWGNVAMRPQVQS